MSIKNKNFIYCISGSGDPNPHVNSNRKLLVANQITTESKLMGFNMDEANSIEGKISGSFVSESISAITSGSASTMYTINYEYGGLLVGENTQFLVKAGSSTEWKSVEDLTNSDLLLSYNGTGIKGVQFWPTGEIVSESVSFDTISMASDLDGFFSSGSPAADDDPFFYVKMGS
mgnify:CR=1 FL=1|jgi:hypothetical protein|tara:strand:+ start:1642 stop:2163 length:522 start_codon:yes stop_codon:yes gene_type:complete